MCVLYFSTSCLSDTYLMERLIQKTIKKPLENFPSFSGRITSCFCQSLNYFTGDNQESLVVANYWQIKSRNCQYVVYSRDFKGNVISASLLHTAKNAYKTLSCLSPTRNFPAQSQLHNFRKTVFRTFVLRFWGVFERVQDWWIVWCLAWLIIVFWLVFC